MAFTKVATSEYSDSSSYRLDNCYVPSGTQNGDLMFSFVIKISSSGLDTPSGWTELLYTSFFVSGVGTLQFVLYYRIANSEGTPYTFANSTSKGKTRVTLISYRGNYDSANLINSTSNTNYETNNTICRAASMSVSKTDRILLFFAGTYNATTFTKPSNPTTDWVEDFDGGDGSSDMYQEICSMIWSSSGNTGDMDATLSDSREAKHAFAVAINIPAVGPANLKSYNTNLKANIKTINTNPIANVKSLNTNV